MPCPIGVRPLSDDWTISKIMVCKGSVPSGFYLLHARYSHNKHLAKFCGFMYTHSTPRGQIVAEFSIENNYIREQNQIIERLRTDLKRRDDKIAELDRILLMYERVSELSRSELIEADSTIRAQETVQELAREELLHAHETLEAHERVEELARDERLMPTV